MCILSRPGFLDQASTWLNRLLSPDNPFVPWMLIFDLVLLLLHVYAVSWVYRDAMARYHRGAPWAVLTAVLPFGGWLFYILYRKSPLTQIDLLDYELFDDPDLEPADFDAYRTNQGAELFRDISALWRRAEGSGYSPWVRASRQRELRRNLSPEDRAAQTAQRRLSREEKLAAHRQRKVDLRKRKVELRQMKRERQTMLGAQGAKYKLSDRGQRAMHRKLEVLEKLKLVPREDKVLEDMIYEMRYAEALQAAHEGYDVAEEMQDRQGTITYQAYIERLERLTAADDQARNSSAG